MRLGTCLLFEGRTLQGAHPILAGFCSAPVADFCAAVDTTFRMRNIPPALPRHHPLRGRYDQTRR